ncbi:VOC family protein [Halobacillus yeomjeoni]|uniref:VOC family protein n=1 Tax=Halobacillus yeomjeoni TaxID=311194 RepID=A0A931HY46_9BACI|nr:VOC family protein [Halobacillus yeomjeoni]MBH0231579.1 VOC family protein [Halobacillus yeomjeoni]MCA0985099.1 VOC family protein [Halobacillus yeomjeoni]
METLTPAVHAVFVHTRDLVKSAAWYSWLLGVPFDEKDVESPVYNIPVQAGVHLTIDDHKFDPSFSFEPVKAPAFNFFSSNIHKSLEEMKDAGVVVTRDMETHGSFGWFHVQDPDGNAVMICGDISEDFR